jgi:hypothetical protein
MSFKNRNERMDEKIKSHRDLNKQKESEPQNKNPQNESDKDVDSGVKQ